MFSDFIHVVSKTTLPSGLPHPDKIQLPTLSPALHIALSSGEKNSSIFNQVLKECEIFYSATYPGMADSSYYQMIGKKMVSKYSCLGFADGTNPWVSVWRHYFFSRILYSQKKIKYIIIIAFCIHSSVCQSDAFSSSLASNITYLDEHKGKQKKLFDFGVRSLKVYGHCY